MGSLRTFRLRHARQVWRFCAVGTLVKQFASCKEKMADPRFPPRRIMGSESNASAARGPGRSISSVTSISMSSLPDSPKKRLHQLSQTGRSDSKLIET
jgi:hypothetical protein